MVRKLLPLRCIAVVEFENYVISYGKKTRIPIRNLHRRFENYVISYGNPSYLSSCHQRVLKKYGLERLRLHDLRHTACSLLSKKVSMNQVRDFMGHEDISTTFGIYAHTDEEDKKIVSSAMDDILRDDD